jgi:hypothetical protein
MSLQSESLKNGVHTTAAASGESSTSEEGATYAVAGNGNVIGKRPTRSYSTENLQSADFYQKMAYREAWRVVSIPFRV